MDSRLHCAVYHEGVIPDSLGFADCPVLRPGVLPVLSGESSVQRKNRGILFPSRIITSLLRTVCSVIFTYNGHETNEEETANCSGNHGKCCNGESSIRILIVMVQVPELCVKLHAFTDVTIIATGPSLHFMSIARKWG